MTHPLTAFGWTPEWQALFDETSSDEASSLGRVIARDRGHVTVITADSQTQVPVREKKTGVVLVGDWVGVSRDTVTTVLPRRSMLSRAAAHTLAEQATVANVDLVLIVCGADRPFKINRLSRAVTQTWEAGATPVIVFTKVDLPGDIEEHVANIERSTPGLRIITVSSYDGRGVDELRELMAHKTSVLVGESGAGKSTLVNVLLGDETLETGAVRARDAKGRHTTTRRALYTTGSIAVIDTPGTRSLGLWAEVESVDTTFADIADLAATCRFTDCRHETEPGCALRAAINAGNLDPQRVQSWQTLSEEAANTERRKNVQAQRQNERKFGRAVDEALRLKGKR